MSGYERLGLAKKRDSIVERLQHDAPVFDPHSFWSQMAEQVRQVFQEIPIDALTQAEPLPTVEEDWGSIKTFSAQGIIVECWKGKDDRSHYIECWKRADEMSRDLDMFQIGSEEGSSHREGQVEFWARRWYDASGNISQEAETVFDMPLGNRSHIVDFSGGPVVLRRLLFDKDALRFQQFRRTPSFIGGITYVARDAGAALIERAYLANRFITPENYSHLFLNRMFLDRGYAPSSVLQDGAGPLSLEEGAASTIPQTALALLPADEGRVRFVVDGFADVLEFPLVLDMRVEIRKYVESLSRPPGNWRM